MAKAGPSLEQIERLRELAQRKGTRAVRGVLRAITGRWWKGQEIRQLLGLQWDGRALIAQQAHRDAWRHAGWRATCWWRRPS
jgi:hypothetical protein